MVEKALCTMIEYFGTDHKQIDHALGVYTLSRIIGLREKLEPSKQLALECAAALHNIGVPESMRIFGTASAQYQSIMAGKVARDLLSALQFPEDLIDEILFIIHHHHSEFAGESPAVEILAEANSLRELMEQTTQLPADYPVECFLTRTGRDLLNALYAVQPPPLKR